MLVLHVIYMKGKIRITMKYKIRKKIRISVHRNIQTINTIFITLLIILIGCTGATDLAIVKYADEAMALFSLVQISCHFKRLKANLLYFKIFRITVISLVIIILWGIISNINSKVITEVGPILIDIFSMVKIPVAFIYVLGIMGKKEKTIVLNNLIPLMRIFTFVCFICAILNLFTDIGMYYDIRYGFRTFRFIYHNPGSLALVLICIYILLTVTGGQINKIIGICGLFTVFLTFRAVALATIGIIVLLKFYSMLKGMKKEKKFRIAGLIPVGMIAVIMGWNQIDIYFLHEETPRLLLLEGSIFVFQKYFPLGSGFATYGSSQAFEAYSILYRQLGFGMIYGLDPRTGYYSTDTFWPMMIAQFSIIGVLAYLYLLYLQAQVIFSIRNEKKRFSIASLLAYLFINSMAGAIYTSALGMFVYIFIGLLVYDDDLASDKTKKEQKLFKSKSYWRLEKYKKKNDFSMKSP